MAPWKTTIGWNLNEFSFLIHFDDDFDNNANFANDYSVMMITMRIARGGKKCAKFKQIRKCAYLFKFSITYSKPKESLFCRSAGCCVSQLLGLFSRATLWLLLIELVCINWSQL